MVWVLQQLEREYDTLNRRWQAQQPQQADAIREEQDMIDAEWRKVVEWANQANGEA